MDAAVNVTEHSRLYNALFYTFRGLKMAAERYSSSSVGGGYGRAGESIRKTSENVRENSNHASLFSVSYVFSVPALAGTHMDAPENWGHNFSQYETDVCHDVVLGLEMHAAHPCR